ncbi:MAG TPA: NAD-dependent epimerase/dehydratase family protein, partial [Acidimicrobiia bacterium]|nr:NAD-dependent epimerase/dehydratase family protein [Acidimicrobiia bacterium]
DPTVFAEALADAVTAGALGRLPDIGGPFAYEARDLARSCQRASGRARPVLTYNKRGLFGAALRAGANLTPNRAGGETWNEFLARRMKS